MPLSTLKETYDQIYADLDRAIELYGKSGLDRDEIYKPNINVAYATYARAGLTRQDYYAKVATYASLAREGYPLMSVANYTAVFYNPTSE